MSVIIGIDVGDVRVGVALATLSDSVVVPYDCFLRANGEAEERILTLAKERGVQTLVIGLPLNEDGTENEQCQKVRNFCRRIERRAALSIQFVDEYGTSCEAAEKLAQARSSGKRLGGAEKGRIDALSAALILQSYIDQGKISTK